MKYNHYAVAFRHTPTDFLYLTRFLDLGTMRCCLPSGKEGRIDLDTYAFKLLTQAEFETHLEIGSLVERDSDIFVIAKEDYNTKFPQEISLDIPDPT